MMKIASFPIRTALATAIGFWTAAAFVSAAGAQDSGKPVPAKQGKGDVEAKQERKKELDEMRRRAERTTIVRLNGSEKTPVKLVAEPLMRFSDPVIRAVDATVWAYGTKGRPVAVQEVECYEHPSFPKYLYALFSLSDDLIEVRWPGEREWSSTKPGIEMHPLPDAPKPAAADAGRLLQMKEAARRFAITMTGWQNRKDEMRLIPRPLHRYSDPETGLQDGAIFAFVVYGTNPSCLLLIELQGTDMAHAEWKYGPRRTTDGGLNVRLDGKEVWSTDARVSSGGRYDTWLYFYARQQERGR